VRALAALVALVAAGCASTRRPRSTVLVDSAVTDRSGGRARLVRELTAEVRASYARDRLDGTAAAAVIDPKVGLVVIGAGPSELAVGVAPSERWPIATVDGQRTKVVSRALDVYLSSDETVGWAFDEATFELPVCGRIASAPLRIMSVYVRDNDRWTAVAEHVAYPQAMGRWLDAATGPDGMRLPEAIDSQPEAKAAQAALAEAIAPDGDRALVWDGGPDALAAWPDPLQVARGGAVRLGPTLAAAIDAETVELDGLRLALAPSRTVAIASATLRARLAGRTPPIDARLRGSFVLERRAGARGGWQVKAALVSVPITDGALVGRTVGVAATTPRDGEVAMSCAP
jgi:hypothetical protein